MPSRLFFLMWLGLLAGLGWGSALRGSAAELLEAQKQFVAGHYERALRAAEEAIKADIIDEEWPLLASRAMAAQGQYTNAQPIMDTALQRYPFSLRLRLEAREIVLYNGNSTRAKELLEEMAQLANRRQWAYRDAPNLVALGKAALLMGVDPKKVLENTFDRAKKADPDLRDAHLAAADVALDKGDFELASKLLQEAAKKFPKDADVYFGLARAFAGSDRKRMIESLGEALSLNENHVPCYLLLADHLIDAEEYEDAEAKIARALEVNPHHPLAWAYRAVMAHLRNDAAKEAGHRSRALQFYDRNPEVDHLIGLKLSQKYRFAEGAGYQRKALEFDPNSSSAKSQLAQDLLRLGQEEEGWALAEQVYQEDGYDVVAYNLASLKDNLAKFIALTNQHFIVRMGPQEAPVYGDRVLELLTRAHRQLCEKYGIDLPQPTLVEIYPDQKDFAVRTFGMPGGAGYLGVCFGRLITANSPATQAGRAASWESVLWHEFCHVVTLQMTKNKMPRWLSEGISVYEELQANPAWGQTMTAQFREMMLGKSLHKISELSAAFLAPPSGEHLMFAYYQSSLVVKFLVERHGFESLRKILRDLKDGVLINDAIARNTVALDTLETEFSSFARQLAAQLAPGLDWTKPDPEDLASQDPSQPSDWVKKHPKNYYALMQQSRSAIRAKRWAEAKPFLHELIQNFPIQTEPGNAYELLAQAHRNLKETAEERRVLTRWAGIDPNATDAYLRLMELATEDRDWLIVLENVQRFLAVNPLAHQAYSYWGKAAESTQNSEQAIRAYRTLLKLDPPDPAGTHYRLAKLLTEKRDPSAHRHLLQALEEAPRFREAHALLLETQSPAPASTKSN